jgi:copper chaperone CopZ
MKKVIISLAVSMLAVSSKAQFTKASLKAAGLTCSMCSKAVKKALEEVAFIQEVKVDIKTQEYNLVFKESTKVEFDVLKKAVEDAGFSVASLKITGSFPDVQVKKDSHVKVNGRNFHFLNGNGQALRGEQTLTLVDKDFLSNKDYKKYSSVSKLECVKTGKTGSCCEKEGMGAEERVYHVVI